MTLLMNIIGAGHLGKTMGHLFFKHKLVRIGGICNTSQMSTHSAIEFIGDGTYYSTLAQLPSADITLIATPDDVIEETANALSNNPFLKKGSIILHCSGSLSSDILNSLSDKCYVASVHPMKSFAKPELSITQYKGTYCAMEGDEPALQLLQFLFEAIGSITFTIDKSKKSLYHAAGVFSSNYLITLAQQALACLQESGIETEMAIQIITTLMRSSISNLEETLSPKLSLTGPIQRGDILTIRTHLNELHNKEIKNLYSTLGKATLALTSHEDEKKELINKVLN